MSDRISPVMDAGRVQQIGTPVEIYERPANVFVAGFIGQANLWPCRGQRPRLARSRALALGTTLRSARDTIEAGRARRGHDPPERVRVAVERPRAPTPPTRSRPWWPT